MSRKIIALALFTVVLLAISIPLAILESRRTPDWQSELSRYLEISSVSVDDIQLIEVAEAQRPERFAAQMLKAVPAGWPWQGIYRIPLPERAQCIRIERQGQGSTPPSISEYLIIGYHSDGLWRTGWLVHEFREGVSEGQQRALLAEMGCSNWVAVSVQMFFKPSSTGVSNKFAESITVDSP